MQPLASSYQLGARRWKLAMVPITTFHFFVVAAALFLTALARAHANAGRIDQTRECIAKALATMQETKEGCFAAEVHRTAGELNLASADPDPEEAERHFQCSLSVAREQNAKSSELRATTDLARLWAGQGKRAEARNLLAPVHGWFTEGLDMADVKNAGLLLAQLGWCGRSSQSS